jgi:hypothetical protein
MNAKMLEQELEKVQSSFKTNIQSVKALVNFDRVILDFCISNLEDLNLKLEKHHQLNNPLLTAQNTILAMKAIRDHDSLRDKYRTIFNQALVLLVSYFGSAIHQIFRATLAHYVGKKTDTRIQKEEIKLTVEELKHYGFNLSDQIASIIITKKDYSFQDMQSINRAFEECYNYKPIHDQNVDNIIFAQACRHVIVHAGGLADEKFIRQIKSAFNRAYKLSVSSGDQIQFSPEEINLVAESMSVYFNKSIEFLSQNQ